MPGVGAAALVPALISGGAAVTGGVIASRAQTGASKRAMDASERSNAEALAFERENEQRRREEFDRTEDLNRQMWSIAADRDEARYRDDLGLNKYKLEQDVAQYNAEQRRRQPYRAASVATLNDLVSKLGITVRPVETPQLEGPPDLPAPAMSELLRYEQEKAAAAAAKGTR